MNEPAAMPATLNGSALAKQVGKGGLFRVHALPSAPAAHFIAELAVAADAPILCITDGPGTLDVFYQDLVSLKGLPGDRGPFFYPALESPPGPGEAPPSDQAGDRLRVFMQLGDASATPFVVTCIQALMQKVMAPAAVAGTSRTLSVGDEVSPASLVAWLQASGYTFNYDVQAKGQAASRGGILDVWPLVADWPYRLEWFGDEVESIRTFDPLEQRSRTREDHVTLSGLIAGEEGHTGHLIDHFHRLPVWVWVDMENIVHHAELYETSVQEAQKTAQAFTFAEILERAEAKRIAEVRLQVLERPGDIVTGYGVPDLPPPPLKTMQPDVLEKHRSEMLDALRAKLSAGWKVDLHFDTEGTRDHFLERFRDTPGAWSAQVEPLSESFSLPDRKQLILTEADLYGRGKERRRRYDFLSRTSGGARGYRSERIVSWSDIQPGDYIVHLDHGVGIYRGLFEIDRQGGKQEVLSVEYADGAKLHVPVAQAHLLSRYIGVGKAKPALHRLGGTKWAKDKVAAEKSVEDLAASLLETQATRDAMPGHAFAKDSPWQHEFEASFPFRETPDQARAILEVKQDMESNRPMDRLICGDVGYGKTEVAMRAAFKAVMDGKQVAMLAPTTVLVQQHYDTFCNRMSSFPITVEVLSRFQTKAEHREILDRVAAGHVDIVIGTHRLVQADVSFRDLGLVIIDEEQKFGVNHKEHMKQMRRLVDVLTLTATPIPRTLYMSLTGARDLSVIETPPVERLPIETIVAENTDELIRSAILRELNREGQVFYLHNRVQSIEVERKRLLRLVPEARIAVAHGQMVERQLSHIMHAFVQGEIDVLLCTTIIESGIDIPNVNTILIDRADRFGMSDLYQLRVRVGRYKRKAYAYLLLPRHGRLFDIARRRIGAIKRHSQLGSGFRLAMRDLELRGAGNILGSEQSGYIAAVGFDLYCQLLKRTVATMKGEKPPPLIEVDLILDFVEMASGPASDERIVAIPVDYIEDETQRVILYRRLAALGTLKAVDELDRELRDRFGRHPDAVVRLLALARVRIAASQRGIQRVEVRDDKVMMTRRGNLLQTGGRFPRLTQNTTTRKLKELVEIVRSF